MNSINITGRIVKDVEPRVTPSGVQVATFSVAVDRPNAKDITDFFDCVAWRNTAEFVAKYFHKGDPIEIVGVMTTRSYDDKQGNKRKAYEISCDKVSFTKSSVRKEAEPNDNTSGWEELTDNNGDLPF